MQKGKIRLFILFLFFSIAANAQVLDSLQRQRYVTRATMYGAGYTNVYDTYLSPQEYKGIEFRLSRESIRMTKLFDGNVSTQSFFQANLSYTKNRAETSNAFEKMRVDAQAEGLNLYISSGFRSYSKAIRVPRINCN